MERGTASPSSFRVPKSSPLENLVRRASSRRNKNKDAQTPPRPTPDDRQHIQPWQQQQPASPLLHTQFRTSMASTAPSNYNYNTSYDSQSIVTESDRSTIHGGFYDPNARALDPHRASHASNLSAAREMSMASQYSVDDILAAASIRDSTTLPAPPRPPSSSLSPDRSPLAYSHAPSPTPSMQVPAVVVSPETIPASASHAGRVPSRLPPGTANFSRPVHLPHGAPGGYGDGPPRPPPSEPLPPPPSEQQPRHQRPPIMGSEEQKRQVLMRHAQGSGRNAAGLGAGPSSGSLAPGLPPSASSRDGLSPPNAQLQRSSSQTNSVYSNYSYYPYEGSSDALHSPSLGPSGPSRSPSQSRSHSPSQSPAVEAHSQSRSPHAPSPSFSPHIQAPPHSQHPPSHAQSPSQSHLHPAAAEPDAPAEPKTPQDYLQLGITHHLANRLEESAACFEKSAVLNGGCGVGMLMWGLAQRHGWGVEKNEDKGFRWLRKAAELAVTDLEKGKEMDRTVVKSELVLAIYEVGQSFFRGWGVEKDKKMAVNYYQLAAKLGDPDAQQDLAFCLANGKGCKKDRKEAAKWYRAAVAQGASDIGLAWIYKEKFQ